MTNQHLQIGVIGDYDPRRPSHVATVDALQHAAGSLDLPLEVTWLATPTLHDPDGERLLARYDALWCAPGSPYASIEGALAAIRYARERDRPYLGT
jgi:CTP synthase (UTP-ammonia lyase)